MRRGTAAVLGAGALLVAAAPAAAATRVESPVQSAAPDAGLVRESYVRLYAPLPASDGARPAACDWIGYLRFRNANGPSTGWRSDAIFVTMPGIFAGASTIDEFARNVIRTAAQRNHTVEDWPLDRRPNALTV